MILPPNQIKDLQTLSDKYAENYQPEEYTQVDDANSSGWNSGENYILGRVREILAAGTHEDLQVMAQEYNSDFEDEEYTQVDDAYSAGWERGSNFTKGLIKEILTKN